MIAKQPIVVAVALLVTFGLAAAPATVSADTTLPAAYYGDAEVDGEPVDAGLTIEAVIDGEVRGSITTDEGSYGGPGPDEEKLTVDGTEDDEGEEVTFRLVYNGFTVEAEETVEWQEGDLQQVNLTFPEAPDEAYFEVSDLDAPDSADDGDEIDVAATVENTGDFEDTQTVEYQFDGTVYESTSVTLDAGESTTVEFTHEIDVDESDEYDHGIYSEDDSDTDTIDVSVPTAPPPTPPADFAVEIVEFDDEVLEGEEFLLTAAIENEGDQDDTQEVTFEVDDAVIETETITLDPGESVEIDFTHAFEDPDEYSVTVLSDDDSDLATVTVLEAEPAFFAVDILEAPDEVVLGETLEVTAEVENIGETDGTQEIEAVLAGEIEATASLTLEPTETETVTFTLEPAESIEQELTIQSVNDSATATVLVQEPATFEVDIVEVTDEIELGEAIEVTAAVENVGDVTGEQTVEFIIDDAVVETETITLEADGTESITFAYEPEVAEDHTVEVATDDDSATATVTVETPPQAVFEFDIIDYDTEVELGQMLTVTIEVENVGDAVGVQDVGLDFTDDGVFEAIEEDVELEPGETEELTLEYQVPEDIESDTYATELASDDASMTLEVTVEEETLVDIGAVEAAAIGGAVLVVIGTAGFILWRRSQA